MILVLFVTRYFAYPMILMLVSSCFQMEGTLNFGFLSLSSHRIIASSHPHHRHSLIHFNISFASFSFLLLPLFLLCGLSISRLIHPFFFKRNSLRANFIPPNQKKKKCFLAKSKGKGEGELQVGAVNQANNDYTALKENQIGR